MYPTALLYYSVFEKGEKSSENPEEKIMKQRQELWNLSRFIRNGKSNATKIKFSISKVTLAAKYEMFLKLSEFYCLA